MKARRTVIALGSAWDAARFFIILTILLSLFVAASGWGASIAPWLLAASASGLTVPVGELLFFLYPERYGNLVGLLVLGKVVNLFSLLLLFLSGAIATGIGSVLFRIGGLGVTQTAVCSAIAILDLVSLASLAAVGAAAEPEERAPEPEPAPQLPEYSEEEVKDYH